MHENPEPWPEVDSRMISKVIILASLGWAFVFWVAFG